jgi:hypothetical protein
MHGGTQLQGALSTRRNFSSGVDLRSLRLLLFALTVGCGACRSVEPEPITVERNQLTVDNRSSDDWTNVEIAVNFYYRIRTPKIEARSRFTATLDTFAAGFGQRFDWRRTQLRDLKLTATLPDGRPFELIKDFSDNGLARALGGGKSGGGKR